jgi:hypothetical protein
MYLQPRGPLIAGKINPPRKERIERMERIEGSMRSMRSMRGGFIFRNRGPSLKVHPCQHLASVTKHDTGGSPPGAACDSAKGAWRGAQPVLPFKVHLGIHLLYYGVRERSMRSVRSMRWDLFSVIGGPCKKERVYHVVLGHGHSHSHGHGVFIVATHPKNQFQPSFTRNSSTGPTEGTGIGGQEPLH